MERETHLEMLRQEFHKQISLLEIRLTESLKSFGEQLGYSLQQIPKELLDMTLEDFLLRYSDVQMVLVFPQTMRIRAMTPLNMRPRPTNGIK